MKHIYLVLVCAIAFGAQAQNVQRETMQVEYISRPSQPLPDGVTTYQVSVNQVYKDIYEEELAQWEIDTKMAQENFDKEMETYNSKGTGAKLLERALLDEKKPQLVTPVKPMRTEKIFEPNIVGAKINLEGLTRADGGAIVNLEIQQFEAMPYEDQQQEIKAKDGSVSYKYYRTMQYRQLVGMSVSLPDGSVVVDEVLGDPTLYSTFTSNKYASKSALNKSWNQTAINDRMSMTGSRRGECSGQCTPERSPLLLYQKATHDDLPCENHEKGKLHGFDQCRLGYGDGHGEVPLGSRVIYGWNY